MQNKNGEAEQSEKIHRRIGPGHDQLPRGGRRRQRRGRGRARDRIPADLSQARLGRARSAADPLFAGRGPAPGREKGGHRPGGDRRHRHHEPARDHDPLGSKDRQARVQRHRLAVPAHGRGDRAPQGRGRGAHDPRKDGPCAGRLLLRHKDPVDSAQHPGRARRRAGGGAALWHGGRLADLEPHARARPRHRRLQRLAHDALQHPHPCLGRRTARAHGDPPRHPARGRGLQRRDRNPGQGDPRRGDPHRGHRGRPAGGALWPGVLRPGRSRRRTARADSCSCRPARRPSPRRTAC